MKTEQSGAVGQYKFSGVSKPIKALASFLETLLGERILDQTALNELYDFSFEIDVRSLVPPGPSHEFAGPAAQSRDTSSVYQAVRDLGLKLESGKATVSVLVIDQLNTKPTGN